MPLAKINNQEIYFEDSAGDGPTIVFMHGFLMDQSLFDSQVAALVPRYRCVRWDARCFGQTKWDEKSFNLYDSVNDCFGLMDFLDIESAILVGMSQGGYAALRAAITSPQRVKALVLMSTQSGIDPEDLKTGFREMRDTWKQLGPIPPLLEGLATAILGSNETSGMQDYWNQWLPKWKQISGEAIFHAMNNLLDRDDITHLLQDITCPALITHGMDDSAIPEVLGKELSLKLPNCRGFVVSPGAHAVNLTHPEIINPSLKNFLDGL
jgi:3-oxoadipate enol-lactonase